MQVDLTKNFRVILNNLELKGYGGPTRIASKMGYTTTTQLNSVLSGESQLSTKAIISLIENLNVNPSYLFFGQGEIFLSEESEIDNLQKKCSEWEHKYYGVQDELFKCKAELEKAVNRYNKLIDITSIALDKTHKTDQKEAPEE
jgi:transcriptional regulator with XRE-family HTH domain